MTVPTIPNNTIPNNDVFATTAMHASPSNPQGLYPVYAGSNQRGAVRETRYFVRSAVECNPLLEPPRTESAAGSQHATNFDLPLPSTNRRLQIERPTSTVERSADWALWSNHGIACQQGLSREVAHGQVASAQAGF